VYGDGREEGDVLNEPEHANVSCTFHYLALEQKQRRKGQDTLRRLVVTDSFAEPIMMAIHVLITKKRNQGNYSLEFLK
jgi:hypothetical protein